jgi:hypothetical protein
MSVPRGRRVAASVADEGGGAQAPLPLHAADICAEATRLVGGDRAVSHGDKRANFQNIADLWNAWYEIKMRQPLATHTASRGLFTARDVGDLMELLKIARRHSGSYNPDDYIDAAGYAGCTGEIACQDAAAGGQDES